MINNTEQEERIYLEEIKERLSLALHRVANRVREYSEELRQNKQYIYEHQHGLDEADMVAADQSINRMVNTGEGAVERRHKLMKLVGSPYFGRIDFQKATDSNEIPIYVGLDTFTNETIRPNATYDSHTPM